jgi:hydrogenase/urease accessory protein HupE
MRDMASAIYILCALTALACAFLLLRSYRKSGYRLLLWSGLCFVGLSVNNLLLTLDRLALPSADLSVWRLVTTLIALLTLLYGLVWEEE